MYNNNTYLYTYIVMISARQEEGQQEGRGAKKQNNKTPRSSKELGLWRVLNKKKIFPVDPTHQSIILIESGSIRLFCPINMRIGGTSGSERKVKKKPEERL